MLHVRCRFSHPLPAHSIRRLGAAFAVVVALAIAAAGQAPLALARLRSAARGEPGWSEALAWLPQDTWAFAVTEAGAFAGRAQGGDDASLPKRYLGFPWLDPLEPALAKTIDGLLEGCRCRWSVQGVVRFLPPPRMTGSGLVAGCRIAALEGDPAGALEAFDAIAAGPIASTIKIDGRTVLGLGPKEKLRAWIVRPDDGFLVTASDEAYLKKVLAAKAGETPKSDWAALVPHWEHVDRSTGAWIVNRGPDLARGEVQGEVVVSGVIKDDGIALRFLGLSTERTTRLMRGTFRLLGAERGAAQDNDSPLRIVDIAPGVVEAALPLPAGARTEDERRLAWMMMFFLGARVYI